MEWSATKAERRLVIVVDSLDDLKATPLTTENEDIVAHLESGELFQLSSFSLKELGDVLQSRISKADAAPSNVLGTSLTVQKNCDKLASMRDDDAGRVALARTLLTAALHAGSGRDVQWYSPFAFAGYSEAMWAFGKAVENFPPTRLADVLIIVDFPSSAGGGALNAAKYIDPLRRLKDAIDVAFLGTQAAVQVHTTTSILSDEGKLLLRMNIPCICWIAMGEVAPLQPQAVFTSELWKSLGGSCSLSILVMKHGAEFVANELRRKHLVDRAVWIAADYSAPECEQLLKQEIPDLLRRCFREGVDLNDARNLQEVLLPIHELAERVGLCCGNISARLNPSPLSAIPEGDRQIQRHGIVLASAPCDPVNFSKSTVGLDQTGIDIAHWPAACALQRRLTTSRSTFEVFTICSKLSGQVSHNECRSVAFAAFEAFGAVSQGYDLVVYRDITSTDTAPSGSEPVLRLESLDLDEIFETHGSKRVLLWVDSRTKVLVKQLQTILAQEASTTTGALQLQWAVLLTSKHDIVDAVPNLGATTGPKVSFLLDAAQGVLVNECSEDLIKIDSDPKSRRGAGLLDVVEPRQLLEAISDALSEVVVSEGYVQQLVVGDNQSVIVRGMAPNTAFLFELRNDLVDGALERRLNAELEYLLGDAVIAGRRWVLDKAAFASIYHRILSQMDQLTPHQQEKLQECMSATRSHISGPAGCGKTFIALHMVIRGFERGGNTLPGITLFIGKNEALCVYFITWIVQRLQKSRPFNDVKRLVRQHIRALHTSPFGRGFYIPQFDSDGVLTVVASSGDEGIVPNFVVIDEAHHIFGIGASDGDRARANELVFSANIAVAFRYFTGRNCRSGPFPSWPHPSAIEGSGPELIPYCCSVTPFLSVGRVDRCQLPAWRPRATVGALRI
jgi:hypothetical protein